MWLYIDFDNIGSKESIVYISPVRDIGHERRLPIMKFFILLASIIGVFGEFTKDDTFKRVTEFHPYDMIGPPPLGGLF